MPTLADVQAIFKGQKVIRPGGENSPVYVKTSEKGIALLARSSGTVRVDTPITVEDAGDVIRDFRESSKLAAESR